MNAKVLILIYRDRYSHIHIIICNNKALEADRASILRLDALRSLGLIIASVVCIWLYLSQYIKINTLALLISLLVLFDLFTVDKRYLNSNNFKSEKSGKITISDSDKAILKDLEESYRVFNLAGNPWAESTTSYFHESIGGYHGAKLRRYQELIENCLEKESNDLVQQLREGNSDFSRFSGLNMLNVKYLKYGPETSNIIPNPQSNGAAWLVSSVKKVKSADEELSETCSSNSKEVAIMDETKFTTDQTEFNNLGTIELTDKVPGELSYKANLTGNSLAVFSEIYYPEGWKAYSGDKELPILRVNYVLRALQLSQADSEIKFKFEPSSYVVGNTLTSVSSILLLLLSIGTLIFNYKNNLKTDD